MTEPQPRAPETASGRLESLLELLNVMVPDGITPCTPEMTLGTLVDEKLLYPDLIAEACQTVYPNAPMTDDHFAPERSITQLAAIFEARAAAPEAINY